MRYFVIVFVVFLFSCQEKSYVELSNPGDTDRIGEAVVIDMNDLRAHFSKDDIALYENDVMIPFQLDDLDNDGQFDEIFVLLDFKAGEKKRIELKSKTASTVTPKIVANVRFGEKEPPYNEINKFKRVRKTDSHAASELFLMEGPGWENDKIAFRNYYDQRNGMDIFGKRVAEMVLDSVGIKGTNYHELADWGMDVLKVGNSLGAGAIAIQLYDTIYPVRDLSDSHYELISDGPLRGILKFTHRGFTILDRKYDITHTISIHGGAHYYTSNIEISGLRGDEKLITGIVNLHSDSLHVNDKNGDYLVMATHDKQAEDGAMMGMGILLEKKYFEGFPDTTVNTLDMDNSYMVAMDLQEKMPVSYKFYAAWETANPAFALVGDFIDLIEKDAAKLANPIEVKYLSK